MLREFVNLTQTGEKTAITCLAAHDWKLESAVDSYYSNPEFYMRDQYSSSSDSSSSASSSSAMKGHHHHHHHQADRKKLEQLYSKYRDPNEPGKIGMNGVVKLLEDLGLDASSRLVLLLAWKLKAATQCEFTKEEFATGMTEMGFVQSMRIYNVRILFFVCSFSCDSLEKLKAKLISLENDIQQNDAMFKDFYQFTFNYAKSSGAKSLDLEMALAYWNIVLKGRFRFLEIWSKFLKVTNKTLQHSFKVILDFDIF